MIRVGWSTIILIVLSSPLLLCGEKSSAMLRDRSLETVATGNLRIDLFGLRELRVGPLISDTLQEAELGSQKSGWIGGGLSALVPGAGQFYAENYWKAAAFLAIEVAAWVFAYHWDKQGDRQTDFFQNYANEHWSVVQYAQWTLQHLAPANPPGGPYQIFIPGTSGQPPWDQVNWPELNRMERDIGGFYSHTLPPYNEQQYYELIGKYPQFNQGWQDANPNLTTYDLIKANLSAESLYYDGERGKANTSYTRASTFVAVAVVNHVLSMADAFWSVSSYNKVHARVGLQLVPSGGTFVQIPVLKLQYSL